MRNISAASLAALSERTGLEPVIIVKIWWGGTQATKYCDRKFETEGLIGKLLEISGIEDIVDINSASSSVSLTVLLDDADGAIKNIYDSKDIHKVRVQVLQWFSKLPVAEAFVIFEGEIASPITWSEGSRDLRFDVVTKLEDLEVGFAAEEGQFEFIPSSIIGQAWPIVFGRIAGLKALQLTEAPSAVLASGFGIVNDSVWNAELEDLNAAVVDAYNRAQEAYQLGINNAIIAGAYKQFGSLPDDPDLALQYDNAAQQYFAQANQFAAEFIKLQNEYNQKTAERNSQKQYDIRVVPITQTNLPVNVPITIEVGNYTASATVVANKLIIHSLTEKVDVNIRVGTNNYDFTDTNSQYERTERGQKFNWIDGGTTVKLLNFPRYYIASIGTVEVLNVWAQNKNGRAVVPRGFYTIDVQSYGSGLVATRIIFNTPLTSQPGDWTDGDIEIDCESEVGPNIVDIMEWVIERFCSFTIDATSFNYVKGKVGAYPANFAITDRKNVVQFLQEVAFQSRCAIWLNDRKFFLRYLPEELAPIDTIMDADVEVDSLQLTTTDTERLVTKFVATWRERLNQSEPNKIIYRYNVQKYGILEETYDFYIYNNHDLVAKSAEFWMIRKSNTFKIISMKVMLHKLNIEAFDPVSFNFQEKIAANTAVTGIIQKATFSPDDDTLSIEAWLPVRLGEMTVYKFAQPMEVTDIYPVSSDPNIKTGNPFDGATGQVAPLESFAPYQQITYSKLDPFTHGRGVPIGDAGDEAPESVITILNPTEINQTRPLGIEKFNNEKKYQVPPLSTVTLKQLVPQSFFGLVVGQEDDYVYTVACNVKGFGHPKQNLSVKIGLIRTGSKIPTDGTFPIVVYRTIWVEQDGTPAFEYWAQPPLWVPALPDEDTDL